MRLSIFLWSVWFLCGIWNASVSTKEALRVWRLSCGSVCFLPCYTTAQEWDFQTTSVSQSESMCPQSCRRKWLCWVNDHSLPNSLTSSKKQLETVQLRVCLFYPRGENTGIFVLIVFILFEQWLTVKVCGRRVCTVKPGLGCKWEDFLGVHITVKKKGKKTTSTSLFRELRSHFETWEHQQRFSAGKSLTKEHLWKKLATLRDSTENGSLTHNSWLRKEQLVEAYRSLMGALVWFVSHICW